MKLPPSIIWWAKKNESHLKIGAADKLVRSVLLVVMAAASLRHWKLPRSETKADFSWSVLFVLHLYLESGMILYSEVQRYQETPIGNFPWLFVNFRIDSFEREESNYLSIIASILHDISCMQYLRKKSWCNSHFIICLTIFVAHAMTRALL